MPLFFVFLAVALALPVVWPRLDFLASNLFYRDGIGFFLADNIVLLALHWLAYDGARVLGVALVLIIITSSIRGRSVGGLGPKSGVFLLLALVIGPGLIANVGLKDHWGRARPREIVEFGGHAQFSPALSPHFDRAQSNGSFVAGDGAFGFFLPAFAFVVPQRLARRVFWVSVGAGTVFGIARLLMGAHFLSDVTYAAFLMLASNSAIFAVLYGKTLMMNRWRTWFGRSSVVQGI